MIWMINNRKPLLYVALAVLIAIAGYFAWQHFHPPNPVTYESQQQAETPDGVQQAAQAAKITMLQGQLQEAADQIAALRNKPPDVVYQTTVQQVPGQVAQNVSSAGADFAIVTDPAHPGQPVNLSGQNPAQPVTLNEYNVYAYKKTIRGITIYPDWGNTVRGSPGVNEISVDYNKRITRSGKYVGVVAGYDVEHSKTKLGLRYSF